MVPRRIEHNLRAKQEKQGPDWKRPMMDERIKMGGRYVARTALTLVPNLLIGAAAMEFVIGVNGVVGDDLTWQLALLLVAASGLLRNGPLSSWMNLFAALLGVRMMDIPAATPCCRAYSSDFW